MEAIEEYIEELSDIIIDINKLYKATHYYFNYFYLEDTFVNGKVLTDIEKICHKYGCTAELSERDYIPRLGSTFIFKVGRINKQI